ncbi:MAG: glucoamylase family protein [Burkholderiaceae bacterium]
MAAELLAHEVSALAASDEAMLDALQRRSFDYFVRATDPHSGLVADTTRPDSPCSIAVVGFALASFPVAVERGWMERADALKRSLHILRFFSESDQSGGVDATGYRGFYYHFLDQRQGTRVWKSELSLIDTALLIAGMLTAAAWFDQATEDEAALRALADALYRRVDWCWAQPDGAAVVHGWKPESGFLHYGWEGYSEALLLYVLGLGSPTHPLTEESFPAWTVTYQWENLYGYDYLYAGPFFIHQFSHAWIDFRGIRDAFMREKRSDYFQNSRNATYIQREYAIRNPRTFLGYGKDCWGISAGEGPSDASRLVVGRRQGFYGYAARGVPWGPDDGTIAGASLVGALAFAPEIALPALRKLHAQNASAGADRLLLSGGFNGTVSDSASQPWVSPGEFGLDQGMVVLMIENYRSGLPWRLGRSSPILRAGLRRAGFRGGWL